MQNLTPLVGATIDTVALRHNLEVVRRRAPLSRVMAVVKANAYGHGLVAVARALPTADAFAVARVGEGIALRDAGITQPIVLLEGVFDTEQLALAAAAGFELVVHVEQQIELLRAAPPGCTFDVWLKADTGMNRLGFKGEAFAAALQALTALPSVRPPVRLFSHFATADESETAFAAAQIHDFATLTAAARAPRSLANSAGLWTFPDGRFDWVRPGLLLYGASPFPGKLGADFDLRPVMTLKSRIIALKDVAVGERVGYGGVWTAERPTRLAIAAVGYGDGYPRSLGPGSPVLVAGQRAGLAGRVSMDMIGIDVTDLTRPACFGDPVTLWGEGLPVEEVAKSAGTIPYELLCGISQRVSVEIR